jgi:hypothetical protein
MCHFKLISMVTIIRLFSIFVTALFISTCSTKKGNNNDIYYIIEHSDTINKRLAMSSKPPLISVPFYGQLNFILLDSLTFFHNDYREIYFSSCTGDPDFSRPPFLNLTPDSMTEMEIRELPAFLEASLPDSIDNHFLPCISSSTDTIRNKAFVIISEYLKVKNIRKYNIRRWTEEEKYVAFAKINNQKYDADSIDWKLGFELPTLHSQVPQKDKE